MRGWQAAADAARRVLSGLDLERALLAEGSRTVLKKERLSRPGADRVSRQLTRGGLDTAVVADALSTGAPAWAVFAASRRSVLDEAVEAARLEQDGRADAGQRRDARVRMGELLGYPRCCREAWAEFDPRSDEEAFYAAYARTQGTICGLNFATGLSSLSLLSHAPCSLECEPSRRLAAHLADVVESCSRETADFLLDLSQMPLLYGSAADSTALAGARFVGDAIRYEAVVRYGRRARTPDAMGLAGLLSRGREVRVEPGGIAVTSRRGGTEWMDTRSSVRPPLLAIPGLSLENRQSRVLVVETVRPERGDLFGRGRLALLLGDLKMNGFRASLVRVEAGIADARRIERFGSALRGSRPDFVVFSRVAAPELVRVARATSPGARLLLVDACTPAGLSTEVIVVPAGRLGVLRLVEAFSRRAEARPVVEPALVVPPDQPYLPSGEGLDTAGPRASGPDHSGIPEVFGRARCTYSRPVDTSAAFAGMSLPAEFVHRTGCTMCAFRVPGSARRVAGGEWTASVRLQIEWLLSVSPEVRRVRIVDPWALQYVVPLLELFHSCGWRGFTLLLDSRVDHLLEERLQWDVIEHKARQAGVRLDFTCVGFENFDQEELDRLNKGVTVAQNVAAVELLERLRNRASDVFSREFRAAGFILFTPWTTLGALERNRDWLSRLSFDELRSDISETRLRLYPELPIYWLAARDGLLRTGEGGERSHGYASDHAWKFADAEVEGVWSLLESWRRHGIGRGRDLLLLAKAIRIAKGRMEREAIAARHGVGEAAERALALLRSTPFAEGWARELEEWSGRVPPSGLEVVVPRLSSPSGHGAVAQPAGGVPGLWRWLRAARVPWSLRLFRDQRGNVLGVGVLAGIGPEQRQALQRRDLLGHAGEGALPARLPLGSCLEVNALVGGFASVALRVPIPETRPISLRLLGADAGLDELIAAATWEELVLPTRGGTARFLDLGGIELAASRRWLEGPGGWGAGGVDGLVGLGEVVRGPDPGGVELVPRLLLATDGRCVGFGSLMLRPAGDSRRPC